MNETVQYFRGTSAAPRDLSTPVLLICAGLALGAILGATLISLAYQTLRMR